MDRGKDYIASMLHYCDVIDQIQDNNSRDYEGFLENWEYQMSLCFALEQIGELAKKLRDLGYGKKHPELLLDQIAGLRNRIAHGYDSIDLQMVFDITVSDIPDLRKKLEGI